MYREGRIPYRIAWHEVFDQYYKKVIYDETTGRGDAQVRDFLTDLVAMMRTAGVDRLLRSHARMHQGLRAQIDNPARASAFTKLKEYNILYEIIPRQEIKFTYDRFFEYLLAKNILGKAFETEYCLALIKEAETFGSLRGAIETALILEKRYDIIRNLSVEDAYLVRGVLIGALTGLAIQDLKTTTSLLRDLLKSESDAANRLAVLAMFEMRPIPIDLLLEALQHKNPSTRKLAVQCAYLLWIKNRDEGEKLARQIASIGLLDLLKPTLASSLELQERIFLNHFKEPDAIRLVDSLGMDRLRTGPLRSVASNKVIVYIGTELTERMATGFWGWDYKQWVFPVFSVSEEYRKITKSILPYLDPSQKLNEESKKNLYNVAAGPLAGVAMYVLIFQVKESFEDILPLIRQLMKSKDDRRVMVGLKGLAFGSRYREIQQELDYAREIIYKNPSCHYRLLDFGLNLSARGSGEIDFITSFMKTAKDQGNSEALIDAIHALGNIGINFPENGLLTLEHAFDAPQVEVYEAIRQTLGKLRVFHPDKVENHLWRRHRELLGRIPSLEVTQNPIEIFSAIEFSQYLFQKMPRTRTLLIEMLERWIDMKSRKDFRKVLRFCIKKSVETWIDRKYMEEYLKHAEEDALISSEH